MSSQPDQAPGGGFAQPGGQAPGGGFAQPGGQAPGGGFAQAGGQVPPSSRLESTWRATADGRKIFRMIPPLVLGWTWAVLAVLALADLAVQGHDRGAVNPALVIAVISGVVYACAFRPRVVADEDGITVQNPIRDYRAPWGAVTGIFLGDSVEVQCVRLAPKGDKTVYSWALYAPRRARARAALRTGGWDRGRGMRNRPSGYARLPSEAQEALKQVPAEAMARELGRMSEQARARGAAGGVLSGTWAWLPVAAIVVPVVALILAILIN